MRLLNVHTMVFVEHPPGHCPEYVIASHRWEHDEITYKDVLKKRNTDKLGYQKVLKFAGYVKSHVQSIQWLWIDTCCIDQTNKTELEYAVNSMFQWYRKAAVCLAYLADVLQPLDTSAFRESVWFRRGWTLQELLAPQTVVFLTRNWEIIGRKGKPSLFLVAEPSMNSTISSISGISEVIIGDYDKSRDLSADEKLNWIKGRTTTYPEDRAYCLLGILDISMRISYGSVEAKKVMARLRAKIRKSDLSRRQGRDACTSGHEDALQTWSQISPDSSRDDADAPLVVSQHTQLVHGPGFLESATRLAELAEQLKESNRGENEATSALFRLCKICEGLSTLFRSLDRFCKDPAVDVDLLMLCIQTYGMKITNILYTVNSVETQVEILLQEAVLSKSAISEVEQFTEDLLTGRTLLQLSLSLYCDKVHTTRVPCRMTQPGDLVTSPTLSSLSSIPYEQFDVSETDVAATSLARSPKDAERETPQRRRKAGKIIFHTSLPWARLSSKLWSFSIIHAHSGWDVCLRTYREVDQDSPIMTFSREGNITGIQQLLAAGTATLQDRCNRLSPLWPAVLHGQIRTCDYLLSQMSPHDRMSEMQLPMSLVSFYAPCTNEPQSMYRLFIEKYGFDVDIDAESIDIEPWWTFSPSTECQNIILNNMSLPWSTRSLEERFKLATNVRTNAPGDFLRLLHLGASQAPLIYLRDRRGQTALHHVANMLAPPSKRKYFGQWAAFGSHLLRLGVDPHFSPEKGLTAFGMFLYRLVRSMDSAWLYASTKAQRGLRIWKTMVQDAGLDQHIFLARENAILHKTAPVDHSTRVFTSCVRWARIYHLPKQDDWAAKLWESTYFTIYSLTNAPGTFDVQQVLMPTICWPPHGEDSGGGYWSLVRNVETKPRLIDTYESSMMAPDPFVDLIESTNDDNGAIMIMLQRMSRNGHGRTRSISAPPPLDRRAASFCPERSFKRLWLPRFHLCPRDSRYICGCNVEYSWTLETLVSCAKSAASKHSTLQLYSSWQLDSFVAKLKRKTA